MSTSYELFFQFIKFADDRESADASGILSQECLVAWVNKSDIRKSNPVALFKRTVISHINGTKKRRQFPKIVIKSLQEHILTNPWPSLDTIKVCKSNVKSSNLKNFSPAGKRQIMHFQKKHLKSPWKKHKNILSDCSSNSIYFEAIQESPLNESLHGFKSSNSENSVVHHPLLSNSFLAQLGDSYSIQRHSCLSNIKNSSPVSRMLNFSSKNALDTLKNIFSESLLLSLTQTATSSNHM